MADELYTGQTWVFDTLAAFSGLADLVGGGSNPRIYVGRAPQNAAHPHIQIRYMSPVGGGDFDALNGIRVYTRARWLIVAVNNKASFKSVNSIVTKIDQALHIQNGSGEGGTVHYCKREAPYQQAYENNGIDYREAGAFWELAIS